MATSSSRCQSRVPSCARAFDLATFPASVVGVPATMKSSSARDGMGASSCRMRATRMGGSSFTAV